MATATEPIPDTILVLPGIRWETYEALTIDLINARVPRLTYARGVLVMMSPSKVHELWIRLIGWIVENWAMESDSDILTVGSMAMKRRDLKVGLEADLAYYLANAARVAHLTTIDLATEPPPDLAIEVDWSTSSALKLAVYSEIGIGEVWRFDGEELFVYGLLPNGEYERRTESSVLPGFPVGEVAAWLERAATERESKWRKDVRAWIRERLGVK